MIPYTQKTSFLFSSVNNLFLEDKNVDGFHFEVGNYKQV